MAAITLTSPAKINLMLRVLSRRQDGYHELQSCFELLPWGDEMTFSHKQAVQASVDITGFEQIAQSDNLIYQAAELLKPFAKEPSAVQIKVDKQIPSGAGLGGGSSNAASTLITLNQLWQCQVDQQSLLKMALSLGADVPFFVSGQSALVTGIGEHIEPMRFYQGFILLLLPPVSIRTETIFTHAALNRSQTPLNRSLIMDERYWINDCLPVVLQEYSVINDLFSRLYPMMPLRLSGTGSTLFVLCDNKQQALNHQKIASDYCRTELVEI